MRSNPRSTRIPLAVGGLLVVSLIGALWVSFAPHEPEPAATGHILDHGPAASERAPLPEAAPDRDAAPATARRPIDAPVVAMGPDIIIVRVLDADTRAPITAFDVAIVPHDGTPALPRAADPIARTENAIPVRSPGGIFKAERKPGHWDVVVRAPDYVPGVAENLVVPPVDARPVEVLLAHGPSLTGLVYDDDGLPVQDVPVFLMVERLTGDDPPPRSRLSRTGDDGRFRFSPLPPGQYGLSLLEPDNPNERLGSLNVETGTTDVSLYLAPRHNVTFAVQDPSGRPVPGIDVELRGDTGITSARTEQSGQALLRYVADGTYAVNVRGEGFQSVEQELVLAGGQSQQVRWITVQPAGG